MTTYHVHTITDTTTGEIVRYVIAEDGLTLGLGINETASQRSELTAFIGGGLPVQVITRRPLASASIRIQIEALRAELVELCYNYLVMWK